MGLLAHVDVTQVIVGSLAAIATIMGIRQARAGQRETAEQQSAANALQADQLQLEELRTLIPDLRIEVDRAIAARDRARAEVETLRAERDKAQHALVDSRTAQSIAEERMRRALSDLHALRMIVLDEAARAAADEAWGDLPAQSAGES